MSVNSALDGSPLGTAAQGAVDFISAEIPAIEVQSTMLNQRSDTNGNVVDVMDIGFRIPPYLDVFYCHPAADNSWATTALHEITLKADKVLSIYAGYDVREDVIPLIDPQPSDYPPAPPTQPVAE